MAFYDMPLERLRRYRPRVAAPPDFDAFWKQTLDEADAFALDVTAAPVDQPIYQLVDVYDVSFRGFGGQAIKAWLLTPAGNRRPLPTLVRFLGYSAGRSFPLDHVETVVAGFSQLVMDSRGQGWGGMAGHTGDDAAGCGPVFPGMATRGIESPHRYYFRRLYTDAVRAVAAAATLDVVDPKRIGVCGSSQGGGIAIAAAGLCGKKVKLLLADVPFMCHIRRGVGLSTAEGTLFEIASYLKCHRDKAASVFATLSYFDMVHFARRVSARTLISLGLMDPNCPPSCVFAAYNAIRAPKDVNVYAFNYHEGGGSYQTQARLAYARQWL